MRIEIEIPKEFEEHFKKDKFKDSLERIIAYIKYSLENGDFLCSGRYEYETIEMLEKAFENSKPAYSVDEVINELELIRAKKTCKKEKCDSKELCRICVVDDAIEIVKQSGVGTETETIRDKAIKWNNNSSKRVPYEFIDFVEGKRDIGVSDDVCEWKKCSSGSADFYVYSSKCLNKNIKEIGTTTNFIDDFKYCPYCGKKIKVVE